MDETPMTKLEFAEIVAAAVAYTLHGTLPEVLVYLDDRLG